MMVLQTTSSRPVKIVAAGMVTMGLLAVVVIGVRNTSGDGAGDGGGGVGSTTPTPTSRDLPFSDDFSQPSSAWPQVREKDWGSYYDADGYHVYAPDFKGLDVPLMEAGPYQDVAVEVDAKVLNGQTDDIASGVVCRRQGRDNYYGMMVFGDGYVSILKVRDRRLREIDGDDRSEMIGGNVASSHIRGDCVGNTLTLYVDDKKVLEAEVSEFRSGGVGLFAYSGDPTVGANILFDNFSVKKP